IDRASAAQRHPTANASLAGKTTLTSTGRAHLAPHAGAPSLRHGFTRRLRGVEDAGFQRALAAAPPTTTTLGVSYTSGLAHSLDPRVATTTLPNGLAVTTVALPHLHTAVCALFVRVGARFETPEDNGLSHFVEHMLFRGTERYSSSLALNTAVEQLGST